MAGSEKPEWLKVRIKAGSDFSEVSNLLESLHLNTVCQEALCPNIGECFNRKTATFMILGKNCTRSCTFCNVNTGAPEEVDSCEPESIAKAVRSLKLKHVVITSVTRDDLPDGGAFHFYNTIKSIKENSENTVIEVLIPDFQGDERALETVIDASPDIINHNIETIPSLYHEVRPQADYSQSIELLKLVKSKKPSIYTKSGLMVGLGETIEEVLSVLHDLREVDCDFLTIGQYLSPSKQHHPVVEYIHPDIFDFYQKKALEYGFIHAACAPLVRSSYLADEALDSIK